MVLSLIFFIDYPVRLALAPFCEGEFASSEEVKILLFERSTCEVGRCGYEYISSKIPLGMTLL